MLSALEQSKITGFIGGFLAFYLLNISIDVASLFTHHQTIHNEQESIIELIIEKLLGFDDTIPENKSNEAEQNQNVKKSFTMDEFLLFSIDSKTKSVLANYAEHLFLYLKNNFIKPSLEIHSPPPEV